MVNDFLVVDVQPLVELSLKFPKRPEWLLSKSRPQEVVQLGFKKIPKNSRRLGAGSEDLVLNLALIEELPVGPVPVAGRDLPHPCKVNPSDRKLAVLEERQDIILDELDSPRVVLCVCVIPSVGGVDAGDGKERLCVDERVLDDHGKILDPQKLAVKPAESKYAMGTHQSARLLLASLSSRQSLSPAAESVAEPHVAHPTD
jgi:hypothetical protein